LEGGGSTKIGHHVTFPELANVDPRAQVTSIQKPLSTTPCTW